MFILDLGAGGAAGALAVRIAVRLATCWAKTCTICSVVGGAGGGGCCGGGVEGIVCFGDAGDGCTGGVGDRDGVAVRGGLWLGGGSGLIPIGRTVNSSSSR